MQRLHAETPVKKALGAGSATRGAPRRSLGRANPSIDFRLPVVGVPRPTSACGTSREPQAGRNLRALRHRCPPAMTLFQQFAEGSAQGFRAFVRGRTSNRARRAATALRDLDVY